VSLIGVVCAACGAPEPSGRYSFDLEGSTVSLDFRGDGKVISALTENGQTEQRDCTYLVKDENVSVRCDVGDPMRLTFRDDSLETDFGGTTVKFDKR
jgi:hypothetical protein